MYRSGGPAHRSRNYAIIEPGQVLGFHRHIKGIAKHETVDVVCMNQGRLTVRNEDGEQRIVTARHAKSFDVLERTEIEVGAGDRLLLTANRRDADFRATNGEIVTVSVVNSQGRIELSDGRILPASFRRFTHGYAVTAHRSAGTCETAGNVCEFAAEEDSPGSDEGENA